MVYAKFITKTGKDGKKTRYGPYYYKSVRSKDGTVKNIYLGSKPVTARKRKPKQKKGLRQFKDALAGVF